MKLRAGETGGGGGCSLAHALQIVMCHVQHLSHAPKSMVGYLTERLAKRGG